MKDWIYLESGEIVECETHAEALARFVELYWWTDMTPTGDQVIPYQEYLQTAK